MGALYRQHPHKKGKLQEIDVGHAEFGASGQIESDTWIGKKACRRKTSSSQKYAEGWDRVFGKTKV